MQLDYSYQAPTHNPQSSPIPLDQYRNRPDRQEPGPVPRDLIPREWFQGSQLPNESPSGALAHAFGLAGAAILNDLHFKLKGPAAKDYEGRTWAALSREKLAQRTGVPTGTTKTTLTYLAGGTLAGKKQKTAVIAQENAVIDMIPNPTGTLDRTTWITINYANVAKLVLAGLMERNEGWRPPSDEHNSPIGSERSNRLDRSDPMEQIGAIQCNGSERSTDLYIETSLETPKETTTRKRAGGGEVDFDFSESEPREGEPDQGTGQAQVIQIETESTSLSGKKDQTGTTANRGSETYSSAAPSRVASRQSHGETTQARILAQAEQKFGEALGIKNQFLGTDPAILALAFDETKAAISAHQIQKSEMGHFISRIRHWLANPEEFQAHPDIRGRNRALASIAEFHELFGWKTEQTSPDWPGAGGLVAELDPRSAKRYLDWLIGLARGLVRDENLRIGEDPFEPSQDFPQPQTRYTAFSMIVEAGFYRDYMAWAATRPDYGSPEYTALIEEKELARQAGLAQIRAVREQIYAAQAMTQRVVTQRVEV